MMAREYHAAVEEASRGVQQTRNCARVRPVPCGRDQQVMIRIPEQVISRIAHAKALSPAPDETAGYKPIDSEGGRVRPVPCGRDQEVISRITTGYEPYSCSLPEPRDLHLFYGGG